MKAEQPALSQLLTDEILTDDILNGDSILAGGDLDGDGQQDAAVLYTTAQSTNVCIAILQRDDTGAWQVRQSVEGLADTVENVRLAQLRAGDDCQLVVGYVAAQGDHYLAVYAYNDGQLSTILEQSYEQYLVEDITGGGSQDLILMSTQEDGGVQIELLTVDKEYGYNPNGKEPRMAIGQVDKLTYVVALAEGRSSSSNGVTQQTLADFMFNELHCTQAYNLDGGNSATMIFNGEYYQTGRTIKNERQQSDFIYFATAVDPETWSK